MHTLDETSCAKGKPLRTLWTADEARMVKHILNNLTVKQWNLPSTEVERDLSGDWTIWIPEGGSGAAETDYAWKISATEVFNNGEPYDPPKFDVTVLGGSAQVLGGAEVVFADKTFEAVDDGSYIYIAYFVWNSSGDGIHAWSDGIQCAAALPKKTGVSKTLVFALGKIGKQYNRNVNQFRVGSIQSIVYINANPAAEGYYQATIS